MLRFVVIGFVLLILLSLRFFLFFDTLPEYVDDQEVKLIGTVASVPAVGSRIQRFTLATSEGVKFYTNLSTEEEYYYGQRLKVTGKVKAVVLGSEKPSETAFLAELKENKNVLLTLSFPEIEAMGRQGVIGYVVDSFYLYSHMLRSHIIGFYEQNLPRNAAAFLSGVVLGVDSGMEKSYQDSLINLGIVHVVAASGMNVTIIAGVFFALFSRFLERKTAIVVSIVAIAFYTVLAGGQASIVRAAIMGSIAFSAGLFGRQYFGLLALFLTASLMLFVSPLYYKDVGFQLSFFSTLGLLVIPKYFESFALSKLGGLKLFSFFKEDFLVTLSAQLTTIPILFYHFGSYSVLSLPVNLLVLWVIPPLMILGGVAAFLSFIAPFLGKILLILCIPFLYYFEFVVNSFSPLHASFAFSFNLPFVVAYYFFLGGMVFVLKRKSKKQ